MKGWRDPGRPSLLVPLVDISCHFHSLKLHINHYKLAHLKMGMYIQSYIKMRHCSMQVGTVLPGKSSAVQTMFAV